DGGRKSWWCADRRDEARAARPAANTSVERGHDERGPEHVRMDGAEAGPLSDRADPVVCGAAVEALAVSATQDRAAFATRGRSCGPCAGRAGSSPAGTPCRGSEGW